MPNKVVDNLEILLLHHLSRADNFKMLVANNETMTRLIASETEMSKGDLYDVIRKHH